MRFGSVKTRPRAQKFVHPTVRHFGSNEAGSMTTLSLFLFVLMLLIGGMAVDLMRFETKRATLQNTIDSGVLAAADLDQRLDADAVVRSYFEKAGFDPDLVNVIDNPSYVAGTELVGREVRATIPLEMNTIFMHMIGIDELRTTGTGSAIETIQNVEISLVLDISGSMRFPASGNTTPTDPDAANRINDLRKAVKEFIHEVLQVTCDPSGNNCVQSPNTASTTINIIPYAGHVNPGPDLFEIMGGNRWHAWSSCKEVTDADFDDADLPNASGDQLPHFMKWSISNPEFWMKWGWCPQDDASIMVMENDHKTLTDFVENIKQHDGTATHVGMKYGVALLNPTSRDEIGQLATRGIVKDAYKQRPANWEDDVVKYIVLMTDGKTTSQFRPKVPTDGVNDGGSTRNWSYDTIYDGIENDLGGDASLLLSDTGASLPIGNEFGDVLTRFGSVDRDLDENDAATVEQGYPSMTTYQEDGKTHNESRNNGHITAMCNEAKEPVYLLDGGGNPVMGTDGLPVEAKNDRITVFTIAFLAPSSAQTLMKNCASSESHYFNVEDLNISTAFQAIAKTINQLRLSQ